MNLTKIYNMNNYTALRPVHLISPISGLSQVLPGAKVNRLSPGLQNAVINHIGSYKIAQYSRKCYNVNKMC